MKKPSPTPRKSRVKPLTDKWIVGMVQPLVTNGKDSPTLQMFQQPTVFDDYNKAVAHAEKQHLSYGKPFVVFAKVCVVGPLRLPIVKTEYRT